MGEIKIFANNIYKYFDNTLQDQKDTMQNSTNSDRTTLLHSLEAG